MSLPCRHGQFSKYNVTPPPSRLDKVAGWTILLPLMLAMGAVGYVGLAIQAAFKNAQGEQK